MEKFDVVVIGAGPGGYPAAIRAAQLGATVALVEKEHVGGTCLNWGCIPTKTLIASSDLYARVGRAEELGVKTKGVSFDYAAISARKDDVVAKLKGGVAQLVNGNGIKLFEGVASFERRNRLKVCSSGGGQETIDAGRVIIATGSESMMPYFLPKSKRVVDSRAFLGMKKLPGSLIVLGGGVIGCEFACMAAQFGVKVTLVEMLKDVLMPLDADIRNELRRGMEKELGIRVLTGKALEDVEADASCVKGKFGDEKIEADMLLVAVGRCPVTGDLELDKAGLGVMESGHIEVDEYCRTGVATVYAIGDVTVGLQLAHLATSEGITAAENACGLGPRKRETVVPSCIFTVPEIGSVGLTEQQANQAGTAVKTGKFVFSGLGKALAAGEPHGFVKWVADAETGQLLGAHVVGAHATELISEAAVAVRAELTVSEAARTIHCHPTFAEAWMEAAHAVHGECVHQAPKRK
jgi:dihydrolipoamide dehydrogenase